MLNFLKKGVTRHAGKLALGAGVVTIGLSLVFFLIPPAGTALWISLLAVLIASLLGGLLLLSICFASMSSIYH